ncbi:hypothetical protein [Paenibacillus whitsoniae]|uniref:Uncharacterized protein n=1 Tax=Paenibacillus whitsoniae TaxID=2496558 RepID=A0A430J8D4_9BACL|nr:hypothetical protein [Paenibacillus whitsoniae]RTE06421.1 hypothetical protein EJQ19_22805 [Paenibacillus whitsoniae]
MELPEAGELIDQSILKEHRIRSMEIFRYDCNWLKTCVEENVNNCECGLFKISCGPLHGYAEFRLPSKQQTGDLIRFASVFGSLKGRTIDECIRLIQVYEGLWGPARKELVETALSNLINKIKQSGLVKAKIESKWESFILFDYSESYFSF